ncbi:Tumor protein D54 [Trachymyrmex septentrionalis]|uniref:Tumor protein D54 n=1 Tax=Trachymyrmex septentrionalis TaxID=34720 RepID=A0A151JVV5_9HYME|nr:Tumor protein D54 [Trachymyrmex septentrionalis]
MKNNMEDLEQSVNSRIIQSCGKVCQEHNEENCPSENEREFESLEYEEDAYYSKLTTTPSFDDIDELGDEEVDELVVHCWRDSNGEIDEIVVDDGNLSVETEFLQEELHDGRKKKKKRTIRVIFQDFSKPYLAKISNSQNYKKFLELIKAMWKYTFNFSGTMFRSAETAEFHAFLCNQRNNRNREDASLHSAGSLSPSSDTMANELQGLSLEEQEQQKAEWSAQLAKVEEEIQTLRHVLANKIKVSQDLKRKLGISVWKELTDDVNQGLKNVKESHVYQNVGETFGRLTRTISANSLYQKTESVLKSTAEKTTSILGGFGSGITMKLGQMRNSDSFRSLEERVGSACENIKTKVVPSRSGSTQSFDEALRESEAMRRASAAPSATSPTIPEDKMLS